MVRKKQHNDGLVDGNIHSKKRPSTTKFQYPLFGQKKQKCKECAFCLYMFCMCCIELENFGQQKFAGIF